jgi:predicted anti-sigma-YlaC factor YlaD
MLSGFGIFGGAVGVVMAIWFIHVGFVAKKLLKEQQETNRILRHLGEAVPALRAA